MACSRCRKKAAQLGSAPVFSTNESLKGDTPIYAKSTILIKTPMTQLLLLVGKTSNVSLGAASDLLNKGAPIWIKAA